MKVFTTSAFKESADLIGLDPCRIVLQGCGLRLLDEIFVFIPAFNFTITV